MSASRCPRLSSNDAKARQPRRATPGKGREEKIEVGARMALPVCRRRGCPRQTNVRPAQFDRSPRRTSSLHRSSERLRAALCAGPRSPRAPPPSTTWSVLARPRPAASAATIASSESPARACCDNASKPRSKSSTMLKASPTAQELCHEHLVERVERRRRPRPGEAPLGIGRALEKTDRS